MIIGLELHLMVAPLPLRAVEKGENENGWGRGRSGWPLDSEGVYNLQKEILLILMSADWQN